jgi:FtsP/CotA-like multicopper oxidase with cupredoxin domain
VTRRQLLATTGAAVAAAPLAKLTFADTSNAAGAHDHAAMAMGEMNHAAMIGSDVVAPSRSQELAKLLYPPKPLPHKPGRVREYGVAAVDREIEVAKGVFYAAWTYNGTVPGPVIRATEGDRLRVAFANGGSHPHTIHFHGIHPENMDGVFEIVEPGETFTYEFEALPYGMHLYHCHSTPLKKHIAKGLYGAFIVDPPKPRPPAQELVMVLNGFDTDGDGENNFYGVNGPAFYYAKHPIRVRRSQTVRIYLANLTEFDPINSFHLHGNFFRYYPTGTGDQFEYTDTVMLCQGQRGIIEIDFSHTGRFMFHAHQSEFTELGWMGFFEVV